MIAFLEGIAGEEPRRADVFHEKRLAYLIWSGNLLWFVMPQLCSQILSQDWGGLSGRKLEAGHLSDEQGADTLKTAPSAPRPIPLSLNDPLFKVSEGGPPQSNHT